MSIKFLCSSVSLLYKKVLLNKHNGKEDLFYKLGCCADRHILRSLDSHELIFGAAQF